MSKLMMVAAGAAALAGARGAAGSAFTETFSNGLNIGGWTYGTGNGRIETTGGHPGPYYRDPLIDTYAPILRSTSAMSPFAGDYVARNVRRIGVDLILNHVDISAGNRPLSLILVSDAGTPADPTDDYGFYMIGAQNIPLVGQGWVSYSFPVPSQEASPAGWTFIRFGDNSPRDPCWGCLLHNVTSVRFFYGNPEDFFIFQQWDTGADNVSIEFESPCPADLNGDGAINVQDFLAFLQLYALADLRADFNYDGVVNIQDFLVYLSLYGFPC
jgi:hypothetical protein